MRILLFAESFSEGKGGVERVAANLANYMISSGYHVAIGFKDTGLDPSYSVNEKVNLISCDFKAENWQELYRKKIAAYNPDLIHVFYYNRLLLSLLQVFSGLSDALTVQECTTPTRVLTNWKKRTELSLREASWERDLCFSFVNAIRFTNDEFVSSVPDILHHRAFSFPNPVERHEFIQKDWTGSNIIFISGLKENKNMLHFLKAFQLICDKYPDWTVDVYGNLSKSVYAKNIYRFIRDAGLEKKVFVRGIVNNLFEKFSASQLHVISSLEENFSLSTLEAMSCSVPTIGMACCAGVRNLVRNGESGLLVSNPDDVVEFSDKLELLMTQPVLRATMGKVAREDSRRCDEVVVYEKWNNFFRSALSGSKYSFDNLDVHAHETVMHYRRMSLKIFGSSKI